MSIRVQMLQVAGLAPRLLGDSADLIRQFLTCQALPQGGFPDREGLPDLYYTVFGLDGLHALRGDLPKGALADWLPTFGTGDALDFVHLCCLVRCRTALAQLGGPAFDAAWKEGIQNNLERFRSADGGYHPKPGQEVGTAYGAFLGYAAWADLDGQPPEPLCLVQSLKFLETADGAWANERGVPIGATNATAAVVTVLKHLEQPVNPAVADWLKAQLHAQGGFLAMPRAPIPDLLSTATALHALAALQVPLSENEKERCLDFIDTLWTNQGGFHGNWTDDHLDCEYTYYGLLALGHLSL